MEPRPVAGCPDTYLVDNRLFGMENALATYLLDAERPAILDAGTTDGADRILAAMDALDVDPADVAFIVVSHVHLDHAAGTGKLVQACENATVVVHDRGYPFLTDADRLQQLVDSVNEAIGFDDPYGDPDVIPEDRCRAVSGGETIDLGDRVLEIHDAPGHAPHHFVCLDPESGMLFAADAVGAFDPDGSGVAPTTPPPSFDLEANLETIDRLHELDPSRTLYTHFGPGEPGNAGAELDEYAAILPEWVDAVRDVRDTVGDDVDDLLAELRPEWESPTLRRDVVGVLQYLDR